MRIGDAIDPADRVRGRSWAGTLPLLMEILANDILPDGTTDASERPSRLLKSLGAVPYLRLRTTEQVGDLPIHCEVFASAPAAPLLVFLPGISTYSALYAKMLYRLSQHGFNVVGIDLRGHGHSGGPRGEYTVEAVQEDVRAVIDHFAPRFGGPVMLYGYSIGAPLALAAAENDERVKALLCHTLFVSEHAPDLLHLWGWHWLRYLSFFAPHMHLTLQRLFRLQDLIPQRRFHKLIDKDPLLVNSYPLMTFSSVFNRRTRVAHEELPFRAAIISGDQDELVSFGYLERLVSTLTHPFELIPIAGGTHMLPFWQPEHCAELAAEWLRREP